MLEPRSLFARALRALAGLAALLLGLALARPALAGPPAPSSPCAASVIAWTVRLAAAIEVPAEAVVCPRGAAVIRLRPQGAAPIDAEILEPPRPAFRRAGRFGVSPIVEVSDYRDLPAPQRGAFDALTAWIAAHEGEVVIEGAPEGEQESPGMGTPSVGPQARALVPWSAPRLLLLAAILMITARFAAPRAPVTPSRDRLAALALFAAALALRLALGLWGPLHVNGQGALWILAAVADPGLLHAYGPGYRELLSLPAHLFAAAPDRAIFALDAALSALVPPLAFALARAVGIDRRRALLPAAVIALDAVAIRGAATESYFPAICALTVGAQLLLVLAARDSQRARLRSALLALAGSLVAAQAARIHPAAWGVIALVPLAVLAAGPPDRSPRARAVLAAIAALLVALTIAGTSGRGLVARFAESARYGDSTGGSRSPGAWALVAAFALVALALARPRWILPSAIAHAALLVITRAVFAQSALWEASYDRLYLTLPLIGLAALIPEQLARTRAACAVAVAALLLLAARSRAIFTARTTEQLEYPWLRDRIAALPEGCVVAHVLRAGNRVLYLPDYRGPGALALSLTSAEDLALARARSRCVVYARTSLCASEEARGLCEAIEAEASDLAEIEKASFPAAPSFDRLPYDRAVIEDALLGSGARR